MFYLLIPKKTLDNLIEIIEENNIEFSNVDEIQQRRFAYLKEISENKQFYCEKTAEKILEQEFMVAGVYQNLAKSIERDAR